MVKYSGLRQSHGSGAEAQGQQPVEGGWRSASLQMAQHQRAGVFIQALTNLACDPFTNPAQHHLGSADLAHPLADHFSVFSASAFRHNHYRIMFVMQFVVGDFCADSIEFERNLRDKNDIGSSGYTGVQSYPAGIPAHDLDHHHPIM